MNVTLFLFVTSLVSTSYPMGLIQKADNYLKEYAPEMYIKYFRSGKSTSQDLYHAASDGNFHYLEALLKGGVDPNYVDHDTGKSPLVVAVDHDHYDAIRMLVQKGALVSRPAVEASLKKRAFYSLGLLLSGNPNVDQNSLLSQVETSNTFTSIEKVCLYDYIAKHCTLDDTIASSFKSGRIQQLKGLVLADKKIAEKVFLKALEVDHQPTIEVMLKKYGKHLLHIEPKFTDQHKHILLEKYPDYVHAFFCARKQIPASWKELYIKYQQKLEPLENTLRELYPEYLRSRTAYEAVVKNRALISDTAGMIPEREFFAELQKWPNRKSKILKHYIDEARKCMTYHQKYIERTKQCCICFEDYGTKSHVIVCSEGHSLCLSCFNNPTLDACPLCRKECTIDKLTCQACSCNSENVKLVYCKDCDAISNACANAGSMPCCKSPLNPFSFSYSEKFEKWGIDAIKHNREREAKELRKIDEKFSHQQIKARENLELQLKGIDKNLQEARNEFYCIRDRPEEYKQHYEQRRMASLFPGSSGYQSAFSGVWVDRDETFRARMIKRVKELADCEKEDIQKRSMLIEQFNTETNNRGELLKKCSDSVRDISIKKHNKIIKLLGPDITKRVQDVLDQEDARARALAQHHVINQLLQILAAMSGNGPINEISEA